MNSAERANTRERNLQGLIVTFFLLILLLSLPDKVNAATVYSQPYNDVVWDLSTASNLNEIHIYGPGGLSSNYPSGVLPFSVPGSFDTIEVELNAGTCTDVYLNNGLGLVLWSGGSYMGSINPTSVAARTNSAGQSVCDLSIPSQTAGSYEATLNVGAANTGLKLLGSFLNDGQSVDRNSPANYVSGGIAFQLCNTSCDQNFRAPNLSTLTRIDSVTPSDGSTISTSTTATVGASGFVNTADYVSGMFLEIKYMRTSSSQAAVANVQNLFTTLDFDISGPGLFTVSTTTSIVNVGQYTLITSLRSPSLINNFWNFIGFGQFATLGINTSTSTVFTAAHLTDYDIFVASTTQAINAYSSSSGFASSTCVVSVSFDFNNCMSYLFFPNIPMIMTAVDSFRSGFLSYAPWGYFTRFVTIMAGQSTTTLPSFDVPITFAADGTPVDYLNVDMQDTFNQGQAVMDNLKATGTSYTFRSIIEPWVQLFLAIAVIYIIVLDLMSGEHPYR